MASRQAPFLYRTYDECMLLGDGPAVKMPCGHAITPDNLYEYVSSELKKGNVQILCCSCRSIWEMVDIFERACLTTNEKSSFSLKLNDNYANNEKGLRACPVCYCYAERRDPKNKRVECTFCKNAGKHPFEFCWECNKSWIGNHICNKDEVNRILEACGVTTMQYSGIQGVPLVRSCPKCSALLEHTDGCKTMTCTCGYVFCFSCLKSKEGKDLACNGYDGVCSIAPRQKII